MEWQTDFVSSLGFEIVQTYGSEETLSMKEHAQSNWRRRTPQQSCGACFAPPP